MCLREDGIVRQVGKPAISLYAKMNGLRYVINASTSVPTAPIVSFHPLFVDIQIKIIRNEPRCEAVPDFLKYNNQE